MIVRVSPGCGAWVALSLTALACAEDAAPDGVDVAAAYGEPFRVAVGERARVGDRFLATFARVAEDSRCAGGARCAEPGSAAVVLAVEHEAGSATLTLHTGRTPRRAAAAGHTVELVGLSPETAPQDDPTRYQATLVVTRVR